MSHQNYKLIEDFINKKLAYKQSEEFEIRMQKDKELFNEYQLHLDLNNLMKVNPESEQLKLSLHALREKVSKKKNL